ncbi:hypothetical protein RFM68_33060 [Mesorhizobium sp. MSK_1335]|uniref:Uncharacterized protein n=1 Tax=Mesorhizobium montanum TaxID=3072323 RepID=A0ABU4ZV17_9HYPH|nr:hypothetical protein [Mesorhizobium sp. MSK_1335]MDX8529264.1 hypothetical protein [Mesorhizobium sp. MSK_1335]
MDIPHHEQAAQEHVKASRVLDGDANRIVDYYQEWGGSYDLDVNREPYCGPLVVTELAGAMQAAYVEKDRAAVVNLDAGRRIPSGSMHMHKCYGGLTGREAAA